MCIMITFIKSKFGWTSDKWFTKTGDIVWFVYTLLFLQILSMVSITFKFK